MGSTERTPLLKPKDRVVQVKDLTMLFICVAKDK